MDYLEMLMNGSEVIERRRREIVRTVEILVGLMDEEIVAQLRPSPFTVLHGLEIEWSVEFDGKKVPHFMCRDTRKQVELFASCGTQVPREVPLLRIREVHEALNTFLGALAERSRKLDTRMHWIINAWS